MERSTFSSARRKHISRQQASTVQGSHALSRKVKTRSVLLTDPAVLKHYLLPRCSVAMLGGLARVNRRLCALMRTELEQRAKLFWRLLKDAPVCLSAAETYGTRMTMHGTLEVMPVWDRQTLQLLLRYPLRKDPLVAECEYLNLFRTLAKAPDCLKKLDIEQSRQILRMGLVSLNSSHGPTLEVVQVLKWIGHQETASLSLAVPQREAYWKCVQQISSSSQ
jgi:hypothetical protein